MPTRLKSRLEILRSALTLDVHEADQQGSYTAFARSTTGELRRASPAIIYRTAERPRVVSGDEDELAELLARLRGGGARRRPRPGETSGPRPAAARRRRKTAPPAAAPPCGPCKSRATKSGGQTARADRSRASWPVVAPHVTSRPPRARHLEASFPGRGADMLDDDVHAAAVGEFAHASPADPRSCD